MVALFENSTAGGAISPWNLSSCHTTRPVSEVDRAFGAGLGEAPHPSIPTYSVAKRYASP